ncbi:Membrane protein insertase YidC [Lactiplantibacillus plantarum subsp. plantarum]|uniref:Membrane protein insertase YidC n=1 Tax=Lactiplantibacillus plantarum subsp. plantarum TaxID=337330 RepID=A0A2S3U8M5_LACPN|nr:Membrane protein insertase YidC [Lactiplantibacillus plantarum subsp. plantarum]
MEWLSQLFGNNYGWAIIGLTVIVRLVLLPMMINQQRKSTYHKEKMSAVRPQMEKSRHGKKQRRLRKKKPQSVMSSCNFTVTTY